MLDRLFRRERGQGLVEYALIIALVAVVVIGILILLAVTAVAVIVFFHADPRGEPTWTRITAPALAAVLLGGIVVLAVWHYNTLLGVAPGSVPAWAFPAAYVAVAATGIGWALVLRSRRPQVYATIGLGAHAITGQATLTSRDVR